MASSQEIWKKQRPTMSARRKRNALRKVGEDTSIPLQDGAPHLEEAQKTEDLIRDEKVQSQENADEEEEALEPEELIRDEEVQSQEDADEEEEAPHPPKNSQKKVKEVYRGCLDGLVTKLKGMELKKHMVELEKTPFKHLFEAIDNGSLEASACKRSNPTIKKILKSYEKKTTSLRIRDQKIQITPRLIRLIFGIIDGDVRIETGKKERTVVDFVDRLYPDNKNPGSKLTKKGIEKQLTSNERTSKDFARLAVLYVLAYALAPTNGYSIGWYYTQFVADVDNMCKYNWSLFLYDMLMAGINKEPQGSMGCVLILAYCLCECSSIIMPLRRSSAVPRCVKWNLKELAKALKDNDIEDFFHKVKEYDSQTDEEKCLLHLPPIVEDEKNDDNVNEHAIEEQQSDVGNTNDLVREGQQSTLEQQSVKLRSMVCKQAKLIGQQKNENNNLKKKLENQKKKLENQKKLRLRFQRQTKLQKSLIKNLEEKLANTTTTDGGDDGGQAGGQSDETLQKNVEQGRKALKFQVSQLQHKLEGVIEKVAITHATLSANLNDLEEPVTK